MPRPAPIYVYCCAAVLALALVAVAATPPTTASSDVDVAAPPGHGVGDAAASKIFPVAEPWGGETIRDLHAEYGNIFKYGNRNAASHLWSAFLLNRAHFMTKERLQYLFTGFCAISGSPVRPMDRTRYEMTLERVAGGKLTAFTYYCCWPCVCDTEDFIKTDTLTVETKDGLVPFDFLVIGNPCDKAEELDRPFVQPFDGRATSIAREAQEVRCVDGVLQGAITSDNGYIIIGMFHGTAGDNNPPQESAGTSAVRRREGAPKFNKQFRFVDECKQRADQGYNSGMGEIFRKVAGISPIECLPSPDSLTGETPNCTGEDAECNDGVDRTEL